MAAKKPQVPTEGAIDEAVDTPTLASPAKTAPAKTATAETAPAGSAPAETPEVVYVTAPVPPRPKGNRILGVLFALVATAVYALALAGLFELLVQVTVRPGQTVNVFTLPTFYLAVILFFVGLVAVVLILNRAGWWSHLIASILVALFVYFGTVALVLVMAGVIAQSPDVAAKWFQSGLVNPAVIIAALLAREVAIWAGAAISWRGKRVKARNVVARENFDREQAELVGK